MGIERYVGRVAVVTGASRGVGASIVQTLQKQGLVVIGLGRNVERIDEYEIEGAPGKLHGYECDITEEGDVLEAFDWVKEVFGGVDILINCAEIKSRRPLLEAKTSEWRGVLEVNMIGLSMLTREAVKSMKERGVEDGYIIHINSIVGHYPPATSSEAMFCATKYAVRVLSDGFRQDLLRSGSRIRNSIISVGSLLPEECLHVKDKEKPEVKVPTNKEDNLETEDVAQLVLFILSQPERVQIHDILVHATGSSVY